MKVQKEFIETYINPLPFPTIDYLSGDYEKADKLLKLAVQKNNRFVAIIQSPFSKKDYHIKYDRYGLFDFYKDSGKRDIYLMDGGGNLYKQIENISSIFSEL